MPLEEFLRESFKKCLYPLISKANPGPFYDRTAGVISKGMYELILEEIL